MVQSADTAKSREGTIFAGKYRIEALCGVGGMGSVYRATHTLMGRTIALKLLSHHAVDSNEARQRFQHEARIISQIQHPNTVTIHDFGIEENVPYLVLEYIEGKSIKELLLETPQLSVADAIDILLQMCGPIRVAHNLGIIHRDIKPGNVMLLGNGTQRPIVKLVDFGIAKVVGGIAATCPELTAAGSIVGTPQYISPEQCTCQPLDLRSDIYCLGLVLYEMIAGRPPFVSNSPLELVIDHVNKLPTPLTELLPGQAIPAQLDALLMRCLAKRREDRFASIQELEEALQKIPGAFGDCQNTQLRASTRGYTVGAALAACVLLGGLAWPAILRAISPLGHRYEPVVATPAPSSPAKPESTFAPTPIATVVPTAVATPLATPAPTPIPTAKPTSHATPKPTLEVQTSAPYLPNLVAKLSIVADTAAVANGTVDGSALSSVSMIAMLSGLSGEEFNRAKSYMSVKVSGTGGNKLLPVKLILQINDEIRTRIGERGSLGGLGRGEYRMVFRYQDRTISERTITIE